METTTAKQNTHLNNVLHILEDLKFHLDNCEFHNYDDADDMHLAKKEVIKILDNLIKRREK